MEKEAYYYWLDTVPGIGRLTMKRILEKTDPKEVYEQGTGLIEGILKEGQKKAIEEFRQKKDPYKEWIKIKEKGIRLLFPKDQQFPQKLKDIPDPPTALYIKGKAEYLRTPTAAVVGARNCSAYGALAAKELGRELAERGITVVSGLARGIDGISQWAALEGGGVSVGVLGSGVEICYPPENRPLYERLQKEGCLLSESSPHTGPRAGLFPLRNRLISGLADVVVVMEAKEKSGTLITVDMALEQGKEVYAMPGRITDSLSTGCNRLIGQGAGVLLSPREFAGQMAAQLGLDKKEEKKEEETEMTAEEKIIYQLLEPLPMSVEEILQKAKADGPGLTPGQVMEGLMNLVMAGRACTHEQYFYRKHFG
ncbi:MAG: DNA-processing protein DprA [Lachnospiraceae bacterium]|nr:DNA-processing protein DprA [Lachnospiraceae bacterium]